MLNINLSKKHFLLTGGNRGIGKSIVKTLVEAGAIVSFTFNSNEKEAEEFIQSFDISLRDNVSSYRLDIDNQEQIAKVVSKIIDEKGNLNGLINNAGITIDKPFLFMETSDWNKVLETNLNGVFNITRAVIKNLTKKDNNKILNISSVSGIKSNYGQANYSASKAAINSLTKTLAIEFARFNLQVNSIAPGYIKTAMVEKIDEKTSSNILKGIPMKRFGSTEEVSYLAAFLLSDLSNYITGQTYVIDGGLTL